MPHASSVNLKAANLRASEFRHLFLRPMNLRIEVTVTAVSRISLLILCFYLLIRLGLLGSPPPLKYRRASVLEQMGLGLGGSEREKRDGFLRVSPVPSHFS